MTVKDILRRAALKGLVKPLSITEDVKLVKLDDQKKTPSSPEYVKY